MAKVLRMFRGYRARQICGNARAERNGIRHVPRCRCRATRRPSRNQAYDVIRRRNGLIRRTSGRATYRTRNVRASMKGCVTRRSNYRIVNVPCSNASISGCVPISVIRRMSASNEGATGRSGYPHERIFQGCFRRKGSTNTSGSRRRRRPSPDARQLLRTRAGNLSRNLRHRNGTSIRHASGRHRRRLLIVNDLACLARGRRFLRFNKCLRIGRTCARRNSRCNASSKHGCARHGRRIRRTFRKLKRLPFRGRPRYGRCRAMTHVSRARDGRRQRR